MTPAEYLNAVIPKPFTILGRKLLPLSIGHLMLMEWQGLAYVADPNDAGEMPRPKMGDLISAVLICSMRFREYQDFLQRDDLPKQLKKMGASFSFAELPQKFAMFADYFNEGRQVPEIELPPGLSEKCALGTPWLQCLRVALMHEFHVPSAETFDYPYRLAMWDACSKREAEGRLVINSGQDDTPEMDETFQILQAMNEGYIKSLGKIKI